jgi:hypothetical protein
MSLNWNLLYAFPGDHREDYEQTLALLPLLRHLNPPGGLSHLSVDRFSPYFDCPGKYGIANVRPMEGYASVLPECANIAKVAYHFVADYSSGSRNAQDLMAQLEDEVRAWVKLWNSDDEVLPALALTAITSSDFLLIDTRGLPETEQVQFLTREQARVAITGCSRSQGGLAAWALERRLAAELDGFVAPLATAEPALIREFETETRHETPAPEPRILQGDIA